MINPLSQDLNGGLGTILLLSWHVEIIHKHHYLLSNGWTIYATLPPVKRSVADEEGRGITSPNGTRLLCVRDFWQTSQVNRNGNRLQVQV